MSIVNKYKYTLGLSSNWWDTHNSLNEFKWNWNEFSKKNNYQPFIDMFVKIVIPKIELTALTEHCTFKQFLHIIYKRRACWEMDSTSTAGRAIVYKKKLRSTIAI